MSAQESEVLFSEIESFLSCAKTKQLPDEERTALRRNKTIVTREDMAVVRALMRGSLPAEALAKHLNRDLPGLADSLKALVAIGVIEMHDGGYMNTAAAELYCRKLDENFEL